MPISSRQAIAQKQAISNQLKAQAQDQALRQKALVADQASSDLFVDDITGDVYKAYPVVLTEGNFTLAANGASTETDIASMQVPNGVEYLFRAPTSNLDRNAPYLYGQVLQTNSTMTMSGGALRLKVKDASQNDLKGQPFTGAVSQVNNADAIDWNKRLFFNARSPIRAKAGDYILISINSSVVWNKTSSTFTISALQLVKQ
jgi:hypothetical protein